MAIIECDLIRHLFVREREGERERRIESRSHSFVRSVGWHDECVLFYAKTKMDDNNNDDTDLLLLLFPVKWNSIKHIDWNRISHTHTRIHAHMAQSNNKIFWSD